MGPAGEVVASRLLDQGLRVAVVERELIGGECAYWACIPSKTLLRPPEARAEARRAAGLSEPGQDWPEIAAYRDYMIRGLDDSGQVESWEKRGATVVKGEARFVAPQQLEVAGRLIEAERIIIATGSDPRIPPIDGLSEAGYWTNREATTVAELPTSIVILGGGPVGIELGQFFRRMGVEVALVATGARLIPREEPGISSQILDVLESEGIDVRLGVAPERARREGDRRILSLADGSEVSGQELLVATGRSPRVQGLGLEKLGVQVRPEGVAIDGRCRAGDGVWAIGDATGLMPFTHVGMYQGRITAADIAGEEVSADYSAIPRVVFSDPEIAAVGLTRAQAEEKGIEVTSAEVSLADVIARPWTFERDPRGSLGVLADRKRKVLIGAWAVAPLAGEWIHYAALAIKTRTPVSVLRDTVAQFPTFTEGYLKAIEKLEIG